MLDDLLNSHYRVTTFEWFLADRTFTIVICHDANLSNVCIKSSLGHETGANFRQRPFLV